VAIGQDEQKQPRLLAKPELKLIPPLPRRERHRPSDAAHETEAQPGDPSITPGTGGQEFGAAVHAVFEQIEWWRPDQTLEGRPDAVALVRDCLAIPAIRALFTPETQQDEALRELPVELMEPGAWWSGVIDRLVLRYRADARLRQVILVDFKTDNVASADALRDRYAWQLAVYRRAVAHALNIDCAQAEAVLVSTRHQAILTL
jgi:ATP-dependent exoDNAse (exonuclease V) beta subunit